VCAGQVRQPRYMFIVSVSISWSPALPQSGAAMCTDAPWAFPDGAPAPLATAL